MRRPNAPCSTRRTPYVPVERLTVHPSEQPVEMVRRVVCHGGHLLGRKITIEMLVDVPKRPLESERARILLPDTPPLLSGRVPLWSCDKLQPAQSASSLPPCVRRHAATAWRAWGRCSGVPQGSSTPPLRPAGRPPLNPKQRRRTSPLAWESGVTTTSNTRLTSLYPSLDEKPFVLPEGSS